jgi:phosphatidylserine decarboxylase
MLNESNNGKNANKHYPSSIQSGWLPKPDSESLLTFSKNVLEAPREKYAECIEELNKLLVSNEALRYLIDNACNENGNIIDAHMSTAQAPIPRIPDKDTLLHAFNILLKQVPQFVNNELVGLPFSALIVGIDATEGGSALFRLPMFNEKMSAILNEWNKFLDTPASDSGFTVEGEQWLSPEAKKHYDFHLWKKDSETLPYWKSWNSYFTRQFKDPAKSRPIAGPDSNQTVISPNDGSLFRWAANLARKDVFWFKDMQYSLTDIFSSTVKKQQETIDKYGLLDIFEGGYLFQTYLNPYNFHRWWVPVNGEVLFDPITIPGCFFSKLVLPDFAGATTASIPYLAQVNARGLIVFKTEDYGHVCCLPLGMSEVSTVTFDPKMKRGATVRKGQEMGMFNYGGSTCVMIYEKLPDKELLFVNNDGIPYPQNPLPPSGSGSATSYTTNIGAQIGVWYSK